MKEEIENTTSKIEGGFQSLSGLGNIITQLNDEQRILLEIIQKQVNGRY